MAARDITLRAWHILWIHQAITGRSNAFDHHTLKRYAIIRLYRSASQNCCHKDNLFSSIWHFGEYPFLNKLFR
jgi:hypothetical protein